MQSLYLAATLCSVFSLVVPVPCFAQAGQSASTSPAVLPGGGLAQHDFLYAGEAKEERIFIVRNGAVAWAYTHTGKGEISDAKLLPNGDVLFAHQFGVTEVSAGKQVVWNFDAPAGTEIHTVQPIADNRVLFIENGNPAKVVVMNKKTGDLERQFELAVRNPQSIHAQFRRARLTSSGTLLVAHMDLGKIAEYDLTGKQLLSIDAPGVWSAEPLKNGNVLWSANNSKFVREVNRKGGTVWEFDASDAPGYSFANMQTAQRLANGNTLINQWINEWNGPVDPATAPVQVIEVTPEKKIAWALRSWNAPAELGPSTTIQILDGAASR